jgi:glycosyltransferase involved in cell wall biosynthesis
MRLTLGVVIPIYIRGAADLGNLENALKSIENQKSRPIEIVVSDDSDSHHFESTRQILSKFPSLNILYKINSGSTGISSNSNNGISYLTTDYVHCLHQDDSIIGDDLYSQITGSFNFQNSEWALLGGTANGNLIVPSLFKGFLPPEALCGINTIGGPSCVIFPNIPTLRFNTDFNMLCDVSFFFNAQKQLGAPRIFKDTHIFYGMGEWQEQRRIKEEDIFRESLKIFAENPHLLMNSIIRVFRYSKRYEVKIRALRVMQSHKRNALTLILSQFVIVCIRQRLRISTIGKALTNLYFKR